MSIIAWWEWLDRGHDFSWPTAVELPSIPAPDRCVRCDVRRAAADSVCGFCEECRTELRKIPA